MINQNSDIRKVTDQKLNHRNITDFKCYLDWLKSVGYRGFIVLFNECFVIFREFLQNLCPLESLLLQASPTVAGIPVVARDTAAGGFPELLFFMLPSTLLLLFLASVSVPAACVLVDAGVPKYCCWLPSCYWLPCYCWRSCCCGLP